MQVRQSGAIARQSGVDVNSDQCCRLVDPMDFEFAVTVVRACARHRVRNGAGRSKPIGSLHSCLETRPREKSLLFHFLSPPSPYLFDYPRSVLLSLIVVLNQILTDPIKYSGKRLFILFFPSLIVLLLQRGDFPSKGNGGGIFDALVIR